MVRIILLSVTAACALCGQDVLTQHNDRARTGANLKEKTLNTTNVPQKFGKLWTVYADGQIVAQPLYVEGLNIPGKGTFNAVVVSTMHNTIYVYDADRAAHTQNDTLLWARWLGQPRPSGKDIDMWSTNDPEWGILSTPVIDDAKTTIYVVSWRDEGNGGFQHRLRALDITNGNDRVNPAPAISGSVQSGGHTIQFDPSKQKQRPALLLLNGVLYIGFGAADETQRNFHGWLFAYDAATLQQKAVWNSSPTGYNAGIWQAGAGPAADAAGNVYVMTGNGAFDIHQGGKSYGDAFVKLKLQNRNLVVKDFFAPCNQQWLDDNGRDLDLGSSGPILLPNNRILGGGKQARFYLLNTLNMGKYKPAMPIGAEVCTNPNALQDMKVVNGHIHGPPVFWDAVDGQRIYVWSEDDRLLAYRYEQGRLQLNPAFSGYRPPDGMPGGMLSLSADGNKAGTGIIWALVPLNGDANRQRGVRAILLGLDAQNVAKELWRSEPKDGSVGADSVGLFPKFASPTVGGGKVFVPTYGDSEQLQSYGINQRPTTFPAHYYLAVYGLRP